MVHERRGGFTLVEMAVVIAIVAILAALAVPSLSRWQSDQRTKAAARDVANALSIGRGEAIRTGANHLVLFQTDAQGNPLTDRGGNVVPIQVVNDGVTGSANQNCVIDPGEVLLSIRAEQGVNWGVTRAGAAVPSDAGAGVIGTGASFTDPVGNPSTWVMFRPDGIPLSFTSACVIGAPSSGAGAVYITNGNRDYGIVLTPLGAIRVHGWERTAGGWT